jgi:hypothetical protein
MEKGMFTSSNLQYQTPVQVVDVKSKKAGNFPV